MINCDQPIFHREFKHQPPSLLAYFSYMKDSSAHFTTTQLLPHRLVVGGWWLEGSCVNDPNTKDEATMTATAGPRDKTSIQAEQITRLHLTDSLSNGVAV